MKKTLTVLLVLSILAGFIDMTAISYSQIGNTYQTRFGYTLPGYMDGLAAGWPNPCRNIMFLSGNTTPYTNTVTILFYRSGVLVGTKTISYQPWAEVYTDTSFEYDTAVFVNGDDVPDVVSIVWCWWYY